MTQRRPFTHPVWSDPQRDAHAQSVQRVRVRAAPWWQRLSQHCLLMHFEIATDGDRGKDFRTGVRDCCGENHHRPKFCLKLESNGGSGFYAQKSFVLKTKRCIRIISKKRLQKGPGFDQHLVLKGENKKGVLNYVSHKMRFLHWQTYGKRCWYDVPQPK